MANKPLKSIKYPGLPDTYTFVQIGTESGQAADGKLTRLKISNLQQYNAVGVLAEYGIFEDGATTGVTFHWVGKECVVNGTGDNYDFNKIYDNPSGFPEGIEAGGTYKALCSTTNTNLVFEVRYYSGGDSATLIKSFTQDGDFTIPSNATGMLFRIRCLVNGATFTNDKISAEVLTAYSNKQLKEYTDSSLATESATKAELKYSKCATIPANSDLNDYKTEGNYYILNYNTSLSISNKPVNTSGRLLVFSVASGTRFVQFYQPITADSALWFRMYDNTTWGAWRQVATADDITAAFESAFNRGFKVDYGLNLNDYTVSGYYGLDGSAYVNAPATNGVLVVYNYYDTIYVSQIVIAYSTVNKARLFIRSGRGGTNPAWGPWTEFPSADSSIIENEKIALFGDSIMSGTVKTPSHSETHVVGDYIQQQLHVKVVDGAVGSIGYICHRYLDYNILELVKNVELTGCQYFVCSAGDNDSQYPIGEYTDTNSSYSDYADTDSGATIMGNIYKVCEYLHNTYPNMTIILCTKPNATSTGSFPTYRRTDGNRIKLLNTEIKKFCDYYGCGFITFDDMGTDGWLLPQILESDNVHFNANGYKKLSIFMAGELLKYCGRGDCYDATTIRVQYSQ